jgi:hypothetical protein
VISRRRHMRQRISVTTTQIPDTRISLANIDQLAHQLAQRDQPPAIDGSFGGSVLPALQEIADTTASELERLGVDYRSGLRSLLAGMGRKTVSTVSAEAEYSDRVDEVVRAEASQRTARDRLMAANPEGEFSGRSYKPLVFGLYLFVGGLTEGLLAAPVATAMGMPGTEIRLTQLALGTVLTLGAVLGGWLAAGSVRGGARNRRIAAGLLGALLVGGLLLVQAKLAPIRGQVVAGNIESILNSAANGHIKVITVSPKLATELFQSLGRVIVFLGAVEGYVIHDPVTAAYRRTSRTVARARTAVTRSRIAATTRSVEDTINAASYQQYRASWVAAAQSLRAYGSAAMSRYLGEVAAVSDEETRAALYEAKRPGIPLPKWIINDDAFEALSPRPDRQYSLSATS